MKGKDSRFKVCKNCGATSETQKNFTCVFSEVDSTETFICHLCVVTPHRTIDHEQHRMATAVRREEKVNPYICENCGRSEVECQEANELYACGGGIYWYGKVEMYVCHPCRATMGWSIRDGSYLWANYH